MAAQARGIASRRSRQVGSLFLSALLFGLFPGCRAIRGRFRIHQPSASHTVVTSAGSSSARSLAARFAEFPSVKDFGAVGDGLADDTSAFAAALAAKNVISIPPGSYLITSSIELGAGHCLIGADKNQCLIVSKCGSNPTISITGQGVTLQNLTIEGFTTDHTAVDMPETGVRLQAAAQIATLRDVTVKEFKTYGIRIDRLQRSLFDNVYVYHVYNARGTAVGLSLANENSSSYANGLTFVGGEFAASDVGIRVGRCTSVSFLGTIVEGCYHNGVQLVAGSVSFGVLFKGCYFEYDGTNSTDYVISATNDYSVGPSHIHTQFDGCFFNEKADANRPNRPMVIGRFQACMGLVWRDCVRVLGDNASTSTLAFRVVLGRRVVNPVISNCDSIRFEDENGLTVANAPSDIEENLWAASRYHAAEWSVSNLTQGACAQDEMTFPLDGTAPIKFTLAAGTSDSSFFSISAYPITYKAFKGGFIGIRAWFRTAAGEVKIVPTVAGVNQYYLPSNQLQSTVWKVGTEWKEIVFVVGVPSDESSGLTVGFRGFKFGSTEPATLYMARPQIWRNFLTPPSYVDTRDVEIVVPARSRTIYGAGRAPANAGVFLKGDVIRNESATAGDAGISAYVCTTAGAVKLEARANTKSYAKGAIIMPSSGRPSMCVVAGTTAKSEPSWVGKRVGTVVTDGTVEWLIVANAEAVFTPATP